MCCEALLKRFCGYMHCICAFNEHGGEEMMTGSFIFYFFLGGGDCLIDGLPECHCAQACLDYIK